MMSNKSLLIAGFAAALVAQSAVAGCPPGYLSKAGHCIPGPKQTLHAPAMVSPVPGGKAALNPQPIPPGHSLHKTPAPPTTTPPDQMHWDLKANKEG